MKRVVITGIGIISALGLNKEEFQEALFAGESGIKEITSTDVSNLRFKKAGEVRGFDKTSHFDTKQLTVMERFTQFAMVTAREAIADAQIEWKDEVQQERTAIVTGTGGGGLMMQDDYYIDFYCKNKNRFPPTIVPRAMHNAPASHISMEFGISGPTYTVSTACSSSNHAIGQAFHLVRQGTADVAITGGSETCLGNASLKAWECMRVVSPDTCRPFSKNRSGLILGEGGATIVLESLESAQKRGAKIYAEIVGFGMTADAGHITKPSSDGAARSMKGALNDAKMEAEQVGYINAHGTATQANDVMESEAIRTVFGERTDNIAVSSTKSMHGHTLGAAGAIEAVATILGLEQNTLPPTANFTELDPNCNLDVIQNDSRSAKVEAAVSNSFAFGGLNATLIFKSWNG